MLRSMSSPIAFSRRSQAEEAVSRSLPGFTKVQHQPELGATCKKSPDLMCPHIITGRCKMS